MRETVCIVLNEREPHKAKAAEALEQALRVHNITSSRIEVSESLSETLKKQPSKVVVLDYLLGDYTTGLDVLSELKALAEAKRPIVFFLTDEPSVPVAVEALQLGAKNYLELDNPQSIERLAKEISEFCHSNRKQKDAQHEAPKSLKLDDLVAQAEPSRRTLEQAKALIKRRPPGILIYGPHGSGKTTLANAIVQALMDESENDGAVRAIDLALEPHEALDLLGLNDLWGPRLGSDLSIILESPEVDEGSVIECLASLTAKSSGPVKAASFIAVCFTQESVFKAWSKLLKNFETIMLPKLSDRAKDIPSLVQRFIVEASDLGEQKMKPLESSVLTALGGMEWPGDLKQLHAVVVDAALSNLENSRPFLEIVEEKRALWAETQAVLEADTFALHPLAAARVLEHCDHHYRRAAALLGCGIEDLEKILHQNGVSQNGSSKGGA